jgi:hypothetical protein
VDHSWTLAHLRRLNGSNVARRIECVDPNNNDAEKVKPTKTYTILHKPTQKDTKMFQQLSGASPDRWLFMWRGQLGSRLKRRSLKNQIQDISRTFVVCNGARVVTYYALASGTVTSQDAKGRFRRNNLTRFLSMSWANWLLISPAQRGVRGSAISIRGMTVCALTDAAKAIFLKVDFEPSQVKAHFLMSSLFERVVLT